MNGLLNAYQDFVKKSSVTSFKNMISISDSLILGSDEQDLFVKQLSDFVSSAFIESNEPFRKAFDDIKSIKDDFGYNHMSGTLEKSKVGAFPLLFRGGISIGDVIFSPETQIYNNEVKQNGINVCGMPYLEAVKLEKGTGKGPRLFCTHSFVNSLNSDSKKSIQLVREANGVKVYEIVWTYFAFEAAENSSNKMENIKRCLYKTLLPPAINLFNYYKYDESNKLHYLELLKLIFRGALKYSKDNIGDEKQTLEILKSKVTELQMNAELFDINDFVE